jgi:signal peptidase I
MWINGQEPTEFGMKRVIASEGNPNHQMGTYHGYTDVGVGNFGFNLETASGEQDGAKTTIYKLRDKEFMACGDNSGNSADSRYWGKVPQENIVGSALLVYWPFSPHAGLIK